MTPSIAATYVNGTLGWNKSDIELTNTFRGRRQRKGSSSFSLTSRTTPFQRPLVFTRPSKAPPSKLNRFAMAIAKQFLQPALTSEQPRRGFHVSVHHSIEDFPTVTSSCDPK